MNVKELQRAPRLYCGFCDDQTLHVRGKCIGCEAMRIRELMQPRKRIAQKQNAPGVVS